MEKETLAFDITSGEAGQRLDKFLVERLPKTHSRAFLQKLVRSNDVLVDGLPAKSHHKLKNGQRVEVGIPRMIPTSIVPEDLPLDIVYEDDYLLVVNKSGDMVVHPAPGNWSGTLVNALAAHCKKLSEVSGPVKPGIVHRIDKGTSGLLVVAKTDEAHRMLAKQFKLKTSRRVYTAIVRGIVQLDNGIIDLPIGRHVRDRLKMAVDFNSEKEAVTMYHVVERFRDDTLLELVLQTGRTHQIRVHMSHIGHPLLGDDKYGTRGEFPRPMLHAKLLGFVHPLTKKYMEFRSPMPNDMKRLIKIKRSEGVK
jgi:23S rRNA pseudouridine1911/1915/1917 synthase